jgi:cellulose 1,4-beta-cellobiosidase
MALNHIVLICLVNIIISCSAADQHPRGSNILITSNPSNSEWWLAYAISDPTTTSVELRDSGSYLVWTALSPSNWGYWIFTTSAGQVKFPISLRLSDGNAEITLLNVFSSSSPGVTLDTKNSFPGPSTTQPPTQPPTQPSTLAPTQPATQAPTRAPTQAPTQPATQAPTQAPTQPATQAPTRAPTQAPTRAAAQAPTKAPTQAPTQPATQAPTKAPTKAPTQAPTNAPTQPSTKAPTRAPTQAPVSGNPFSGTQFYINPHYTLEVDSSIATNPTLSSKLAKVKTFASAFWIDRMSVINNVTTILTQARAQAAQSGQNVMAALVVYDLPARDCAALASNGEISCADANCVAGINTYKTGYIDPIVSVLQAFPDITIVTIIEPDSLPNLATNLGVAKCVLAANAYKTGVAYAIQRLSTLSNVHIYVDAAHGGWLGWDTGRSAAVAVFAEVLTAAGGASKIRGFSTNVANYQPLGSMSDTSDPCNLASQYNFATNEVKYVSLLDASLAASGITGMHYIIDTGRNGVINARSDCSNWCNINRAGLGIPPTVSTTSSGLNNIDAYFWVKPPGESDGTSDTTAVRYDPHCGSVDSVKPAPEAGNWFSTYFVMLANNANPSL